MVRKTRLKRGRKIRKNLRRQRGGVIDQESAIIDPTFQNFLIYLFSSKPDEGVALVEMETPFKNINMVREASSEGRLNLESDFWKNWEKVKEINERRVRERKAKEDEDRLNIRKLRMDQGISRLNEPIRGGTKRKRRKSCKTKRKPRNTKRRPKRSRKVNKTTKRTKRK